MKRVFMRKQKDNYVLYSADLRYCTNEEVRLETVICL
jgi:hypothetical protein